MPYSKISILRPQLQNGYAYFRGRTVPVPMMHSRATYILNSFRLSAAQSVLLIFIPIILYKEFKISLQRIDHYATCRTGKSVLYG